MTDERVSISLPATFASSLRNSTTRSRPNSNRSSGIERKQFWWSVTHSHSAPEVGPHGVYDVLLKGRSDHEWDREYTEQIKTSLISSGRAGSQKTGARTTADRLSEHPLRISTAARRDVDGKISLGLNPDGPVDRQIGLIRLERPDGSPIALVANYAIHGTVLSGKSEAISGDAPGVVAAYVEEKLGAPVLHQWSGRQCGADLFCLPGPEVRPPWASSECLLGDRILQANARYGAQARPTSRIRIRAKRFVETPLKPGLEWPAELAFVFECRFQGKTLVRLPVRFLTIEGRRIWAAPVELFSEIAMDIRNNRRSRIRSTSDTPMAGSAICLPRGIRRRRIRTDDIGVHERRRSRPHEAVVTTLKGCRR